MKREPEPKPRAIVLIALSVLTGIIIGHFVHFGAREQPASFIDTPVKIATTSATSISNVMTTIVETRATSSLILERAVPIIATDDVQKILPTADPFVVKRHKSCAVVGNSGILLQSGHGAAIDAHDLVVRFNWPAIGSSYEADVGRRTDIMVVGRSVSLHSRYQPFASFQNFSHSIAVISEVHGYDQWDQLVRNHAEQGAPHEQYAFSQYWLQLTDAILCARPSSKCSASTGLRGVMLALRICEHVDMYGFGPAARIGYAPYFANSKSVMREASIYNYHEEMQFLESLAARTQPLPGVLKQTPLGTLKIDTSGIVHKDSYPKLWTKYPRLRLYNEDYRLNNDDFDEVIHREPPLIDGAPEQLAPIARTHAYVNEPKPRSLWDYHAYKIQYSSNKYERGAKLGHGTYGDVYRARDPVQGVPAVLKYLKPQDKRPWILAREIMILQALGGRNSTIKLLDVALADDNQTILVMPEIHLASWSSLAFEDIHIRYYTYKMFEGLAYAHSQGILHNDIKPLNLLIDTETRLQVVADWGLGEYYFPYNSTVHNEPLSFHVGTRHWKAPELLLGSRHYNYAVDVWSAGCTFIGMLFHRMHFFLGEDNQHQIVLITEMLGTEALDKYIAKYKVPVDSTWYNKYIGQWNRKSWASQFTPETAKFHDVALEDLLTRMMAFDPDERATAKEVMENRYFDPVRHLTTPPPWPWTDAPPTEFPLRQDVFKLKQ